MRCLRTSTISRTTNGFLEFVILCLAKNLMRRRLIQLVLVCWGAFALAGAAEPPTRGPVPLLSEVTLRPRNVWLSDLLPPAAPNSLLVATGAISLGRAPEPGSVRRIPREELEQALIDRPELLAEIAIPKDVVVRRVHHPVTREQVAAVIGAALGRGTTVDPATLGLQFSTPVYFTGDDPGLEVTEIEFDALHRATKFRLWTSREPENLPFYVTAPGSSKVTGRLATPAEVRAETKAPTAVAAAESGPPARPVETTRSPAKRPETLVRAGVATRLVIQGADYRLTSTVIPLQPGVLGQEIRVRDPFTLKILTAQVAGPGLLTGTL
jgi:hypothetical protein